MLRLRKGRVVAVDPLAVEIAGEIRKAWADPALVGPAEVGDEVVVNAVAVDLGLGSGGFDVVHVNLTRGLAGGDIGPDHVIKLNYSSLQHPVAPLEAAAGEGGTGPPSLAVVVLPLHGHLAPVAFAAAAARPGIRAGFIQAGGGALPGRLSRDVADLRKRGLICGHVTAGTSYGAEAEAITLIGALDAAAGQLGWDLAIVGPGPGILGSATRFGHGGMAALDAAHTALALGLPTVISPRLSESDPRPRHRGLSHHTSTVLSHLLAPVSVAMPAMAVREALASARGDLEAICEATGHRVLETQIDLAAYGDSRLPRRTMGRDLYEDELFFAAPLAAGTAAAGI